MLLNHFLISEYENENTAYFEELIDSFSLDWVKLDIKPLVIQFGDMTFSKKFWDLSEKIMVSTFDEHVTLSAPSKENYSKTEENIHAALKEIEAIAPAHYGEVKCFASTYLVCQSKRFIAGSSFPLIGLIGIADRHDLKTTIEYIIHETAHQYIYHLTVFDGLCEGEGMFKSPLRKDPRPIEGIYHATFVLARIISFYKSALGKSKYIPDDFIKSQIMTYSKKYHDGYEVIAKNATLTDLGKELIESTKPMVNEYS